MKRRPRITIAQAFDMVPTGGSVLMRWPVAELQAEADKRNARLSGEWYSITLIHDDYRDITSALVTRSEQWASAREGAYWDSYTLLTNVIWVVTTSEWSNSLSGVEIPR